jgi:hypothetical protein
VTGAKRTSDHAIGSKFADLGESEPEFSEDGIGELRSNGVI